MYTLIELEKDIESIIQELAVLRAQKGHDYSGEEDTFANLRDYGWMGVEVRLNDKQHRIKNFLKQGVLKVQDEKIEDTLRDRINYALFALILYRQEKALRHGNITLSSKKGFASQGTPASAGKPGIVSYEDMGEV